MHNRTTSLCLIVWNEKPGCEIDLPRIDLGTFDEVFAIDGGSTDGSVEVLQRFGVRVHAQRIRSLNAAYHQAVETTTCDQMIVFFPKGTLDPGILVELKTRLNTAELVIASRIGPGARNEEDDKLLRIRKWGILALALFSSTCWRREGPVILDVLHGVKGFSINAFRKMKVSPTGVTIDLEMAVRAYRLRLARASVPVIEHARVHGESRFKIIPTGRRLGGFLLRELFHPPLL